MLDRPLVIAHRGASGYLPEHTLQAKALAHAQGADFLEQDVVATGDGRLVVCHDIFLDRVTNVREVYPDRARADGRHYMIDFDWDEVRRLEVSAPRKPEMSSGDEPYRLCTLEEEIQFIQELNRNSGRDVGIYPEIKQPRWHAEHGCDVGRAMLHVLELHGYRSAQDPVFVQCFDDAELRRIKRNLGSELRLVQLVGRSTDAALLSPGGLATVAEYAVALAPSYRQLLAPGQGGDLVATALAHTARAAGLELHPYTFNREDLPGYAVDLESLLGLVYTLIDPDAVFCDYPDVAVGLRERASSLVAHPV